MRISPFLGLYYIYKKTLTFKSFAIAGLFPNLKTLKLNKISTRMNFRFGSGEMTDRAVKSTRLPDKLPRNHIFCLYRLIFTIIVRETPDKSLLIYKAQCNCKYSQSSCNNWGFAPDCLCFTITSFINKTSDNFNVKSSSFLNINYINNMSISSINIKFHYNNNNNNNTLTFRNVYQTLQMDEYNLELLCQVFCICNDHMIFLIYHFFSLVRQCHYKMDISESFLLLHELL
ncbi:hypothetical protein AGLY_003598 [Aphis glycines]|uniref:Uncharacterized protein n=1 Tax=Aphis glycines TaxID=307491 RepID=A0A6G0U014_APHGL|nr:hypothetical protein AGLY_003598 [Aphis glycines]